MIYHKATIEEGKITYQPYIKNIKGDVVCIGVGFLFWLIAFLLILTKDNSYREAFAGCIFIGILAVFIGVYRITFLERIAIIFDAKKRCIYKKQPWGSPWKAMNFDDVYSVITSSEYGSFCYCLTHKNNVFGSNQRISNDFKASKIKPDRAEYEEILLPAIVEMIGIPRKTSIKISEGNMHMIK